MEEKKKIEKNEVKALKQLKKQTLCAYCLFTFPHDDRIYQNQKIFTYFWVNGGCGVSRGYNGTTIFISKKKNEREEFQEFFRLSILLMR